MAELSDKDFWTKASNPSQVHEDGDLRVMVLPIQARMDIIYRTKEELFQTTMRSAFLKAPFLCAINGIQYSVSMAGKMDAAIGNDPVAASETTPDGLLIKQGKIIGGRSAPQMFFLAHDYKGDYSFGQGDPPLSAARGVGGLGPIIINRLPYGIGNKCKAPVSCPPSGSLPASAEGYVTQRNNLTYADQQNRDTSVGKTIFATNKDEGKLLIIVQPHGKTGTSFDAMKSSLLGLGCDNAVFLDGSDSSMLYVGRFAKIPQGANKDETNTVALAFYL